MNPKDISAVVDSYLPRGLFLDANLIVLLVVGAISRHLVARHKRTNAYTARDFDLLVEFAGQFQRRVTTVNVLTEASNLLSSRDEQVMLKGLCIERWDELSITGLEAAGRSEYPYLGLADAATIQGIAGSYLVLTADQPLVVALQALSKPVLWFEWLRAIAGIGRA